MKPSVEEGVVLSIKKLLMAPQVVLPNGVREIWVKDGEIIMDTEELKREASKWQLIPSPKFS